MVNKIIIFSSRSDNMRIVLQRLVYGADPTRPEQRGLLSVIKNDIILLYDITKRLLIGPFVASSPILHSNDPLWGENRWPYRVRLEPSQAKIGILKGRKLLDLLLTAGKLSLREPSALETYWIHPLVLDEAKTLLEGFLESALYLTYNRLLQEFYDINRASPWEPPGDTETLNQVICQIITSQRKYNDWVIEALLPQAPTSKRRLSPPGEEAVSVNGLYLYHRKYLDIAFFSENKYASIIEVKRDLRDLGASLNQLLYYVYAVSRGFEINIGRITPILVIHSDIKDNLNYLIDKIIEDVASQYGVSPDRITIVKIDPLCRGEKFDVLLDVIW